MSNSNKTCQECSNSFWTEEFSAELGFHLACTNCGETRKRITREPKGCYISSVTTRFGDTYFLTAKGWVNMIGIDTAKNKITYLRKTANVRYWLQNPPYGSGEVKTEFTAY